MKQFCCVFSLVIFLGYSLLAQRVSIQGNIVDPKGKPIPNVSVTIQNNSSTGTSSDSLGQYRLRVNLIESTKVIFQHVEYKTRAEDLTLEFQREQFALVVLQPDTTYLQELQILAGSDEERKPASITSINPKDVQMLPSAFNDFNKVLSTLPGVISNNELSSSYAVRGGNFDENLVYVNDIPIYRPFLVSAGQQEGLSFVNPDLISDISFSAGGWQAKYGDKLSSSLNIQYKNPKKNRASLAFGLLGGAAHVSLYNKKRKEGVMIGVRHKNSRYLLNTLETKGEYFPAFTDVQVLLSKELGRTGRTSLEILSSYARNRYLIKPESQENTFGTFQRVMRLSIFFQGNEVMEYDTYQSGIKLSHIFSKRFVSDVILSGLYTLEREYYDIEGAYRLCDIASVPGSNQAECITIRGVGSNYRYARNRLDAQIFNVESRNTIYFDLKNELEFGVGYSSESIKDVFDEYSFSDSSDFVTIIHSVNSKASLLSFRLTAYLQNTTRINPSNVITYGVRFNYWDLNGQFLISPRVQYSHQPRWQKDFIFRAAIGLYQQPAFFRELRNAEGDLNKSIKAQSSLHNIIGFDYNFKLWGRNFKWVTEAYYKYIENVIPYEVDNVRVRYSAINNGTAYAAGIDARISGEFIEGAESWFSLGILNTKIDIKDDEKGYIRRPSDQRVNVGVYFQDHIPNDPSIRMYLSLLYGSGLPFGPPGNERFRNAFIGRAYKRVDIGFSKIFNFDKKKDSEKILKSLWLSLEVLNLLGNNNVLSYTFVEAVNSQQFAVPNTLSARFVNLKVIGKF